MKPERADSAITDKGSHDAGLASLLARRDLLRMGGISVAANILPSRRRLMASDDTVDRSGPGKAKSVIFLWMGGGVTHIDSFDPKPLAPAEVRGTLDDIATNVPGIRFCETLPCLSKVADKLAVLRSFSHDSDDHLLSQVYTLSGRRISRTQLFSEPNIGSVVWRTQASRNGLPGYIAVPGITRPGPPPHNLFVGGWLGSKYAPYCLGGLPEQPDFSVGEKLYDPPAHYEEELRPQSLDLSVDVPLGRLAGRQALRDGFDQSLRALEQFDSVQAPEAQFQNGLRLLHTPALRTAFEVGDEPSSIREKYGRTKIGGRCLTARRLIEAGARFVMVDYGYDPDYGNVWDNHNAPVQNHPPIQQMVFRGYHLAGMDRAFAALIDDLSDRGLLDSTLVVFVTEFGRTPIINKLGGRDHWGRAGSLFFAGAGIQPGQVVGQTDRTASRPVTRPYGPWDVAATIYHLLGINHEGFTNDFQNRPRPILDEGVVIRELLA